MREPLPADVETGKDSGFVLLAVLLVSLILIASASALTHAVRGRIALTTAVGRSAEAEALADAGVHLAMLDIEDARGNPQGARRFPTGAAPVFCSAPDGKGTITIAVRDEAGKININSRNEALLRAFLAGLGLEDGSGQPLLDRLLDYRDADTITRDGAPETGSELVSNAGPDVRLKNRPFDVVEELAQVPGFPGTAFERARPYLTLYSDIDGFDPAHSPPGLREIIANGAARSGISGLGSAFGSSQMADGVPRQFIARGTQRALAIVATASVPSGGLFTREVVVKLSASGSGGYVIRRWLQGSYTIAPSAGSAIPPC
jgi:general secretion pathway protein K